MKNDLILIEIYIAFIIFLTYQRLVTNLFFFYSNGTSYFLINVKIKYLKFFKHNIVSF